jgi:ubiquinone/menaquinone biosynthesis C-methylase UbiE
VPDHFEIYRSRAADYERLVAREDHEGRILPALEAIVPLAALDVVEFGAGTGRLTCLLAPRVASISAFDISAHMLEVAAARLRRAGLGNWRTEVADHRRVPAPDGAAGLAIAGWSVCYLVTWEPERWRAEVDRALAEMRRVLRPGGTAVLLETLGTGREEPEAPAPLTAYYDHLAQHGYARTWIRTDYRFADRSEAEELVRFFFGEEMTARLAARDGAVTLPECTGIWWQRLPASP